MSDYKERLKANAEEFDTIVSGMLARITDLEAQLAAQARIFEEVNKLFEGIRSGITGSMGSINNVYLPQLGRESIDSLHESIKGLHESIKAAVPKQEK